MKIYIAAPYAVRDELRSYALDLTRVGHTITSSWLDATHEINQGSLETAPDLSDAYAQQHSMKDIEEVMSSDLLIFVTWDKAQHIAAWKDLGGNSGGRHVETGVALSHDIPVIVWGAPENIFHRGLCTPMFSWKDILDHIGPAPKS